MISDFFHMATSNLWSLPLAILFLGVCIFVHELGHYAAARWRGLHVERFSIGFGGPIWSWKDKSGVEWRVAWFPLGGYVLLPQIADLGSLEGNVSAEVAKLPEASYVSKLIVLVAGAAFNVLFAFLLACILWPIGIPEASSAATTTVGAVAPVLQMPSGKTLPSPASLAGLKPGDTILAVDGNPVHDWNDLTTRIVLGSGRGANGQPEATLKIERDGKPLTVRLHPILSGEDGTRQIGIQAAMRLTPVGVAPGSPAARSGLKAGDELVTIDGQPIAENPFTYLTQHWNRPVALQVIRDGAPLRLTLPPRPSADPKAAGIADFDVDVQMTHPSPFSQVWSQVTLTFRGLASVINPHSNVGLSKMSGPIGIVHIFNAAAEAGFRALFTFAILINVNLAILNLLPIPVFDGGHILFATIGRIRRRSLPMNFILATQGAFFVLILVVFSYVSVFDVRRIVRDDRADRAAAAAPAAPAPASAPAPAKP